MDRIKRPCARPNCPELVEKGYCATHAASNAATNARLDRERGSACARGYDRAWKRVRREFLADPNHAKCADCRTAEAREVHHKKKVRDFPELRLVFGNLLGLCKSCHAARTLRGE